MALPSNNGNEPPHPDHIHQLNQPQQSKPSQRDIHLQQDAHAQHARDKYGIVLHQTRCHHGADRGQVGTIAYVGPVASASNSQQLYAGIIWDDPTKGKHNGSVICRKTGQLVQHLSSCPHHPTAASFVKLEKLELGRALSLTVLQERYVQVEDEHLEAPNNRFEHVVSTHKPNVYKPIEFYGEIKIRKRQQLGTLTSMSLRRYGLCKVDNATVRPWVLSVQQDGSTDGSSERIHVTRHVEQLDLAGNLLSDWDAVQVVLLVFEDLTVLSLASNRLRDLVQPLPTVSSSLVHLNVRHCHIERLVETLTYFGQSFSALSTLNVSGNPIQWPERSTKESLEAAQTLVQHLPALEWLDLSDCQLDRSNDIQLFSKLPNLKHLNLDDNRALRQLPRKISSEHQLDDENMQYFPSLQHLQVEGTSIEDWMAIEGLQDMPRLESLRLGSTPLSDAQGMATTRSHLIARHEALTMVNSTPVSDRERLDAQRRYVGTVSRLLSKCPTETEKQAILQSQHPRYTALAEKHQTAAAAGAASSQANGSVMMLSDALLSVTLQSMAAQSCEREPLIRRLPSSLTVGKIKALLSRQFGLDVDLQELVSSSEQSSQAVPTALDEDDRDLAYYGVADGSTIFMHERDVQERPKEDRERQELLERVEQQESELHDFMERQKRASQF